MTLLLLCNRFPPVVDGVGDYTANLAQALQGKGVQVHIICRAQNSIDVPERISVHPIITSWNRKSRKKILDLSAEINPDWIGIQYVPTGFQRHGLPWDLSGLVRALKKSGHRIFTMFHEVRVRKHGIRSCLIGSAQHWIAQALCRYSDKTLTSIELYARLLDSYREQTNVIPIGSNILPVPEEQTGKRSFPKQELVGCGPILCTFGDRDIRSLLQAVQQLLPDFPDLRLIVCGKNRTPVDRRQFPFAMPTGYLEPSEIEACLQASDLFILPDPVSANGHGGSSNKSGSLAAACAAGLPIIGTQGNLNNALLEHGKNIYLVGRPNADALKKAIKTLLDQPELRKTLGASSRRLYRKHLAWNVLAERYLDILNDNYTGHDTR
ncbi:MAG: glycosyltransferase family 4 protein [Lewinellaceae bacterium]|nr:glycosyltransferase family 4 protein [Lewinellaceae bacterium]